MTETTANSIPAFAALGLSAPVLKAIAEMGYSTPSPVQAGAIPAVLEGRDVMAAARTGTGKTAGFALPLVERLSNGAPAGARKIKALIVTPTRELAAQIDENVTAYSRHLKLRNAVVFGGVKINPQISRLSSGVEILTATPGRLLDLHSQKAIDFSDLETLVLDEADRMLDMGFIHDIRRLLKLLPTKRQTLLFSATFSDEIRGMANKLLNDPVAVEASPRNTTAEKVEQHIHTVEKSHKPSLLKHLILKENWHQVLVFTRTKHGANRLATKLEKSGISAAAIHGNKSQNARTKALAGFKNGEVRVLVATDIAARGLDIEQLPQVVNYELPNVPEDYVHRIGRTGRAGASGRAISLVSSDERKELGGIERLLKGKLKRVEVEGFVPEVDVEPEREPRQPRGGQRTGGKPAGEGRGNGGQRTGGARSDGQRTGGKPAGEGRGNGGQRSDGQRTGGARSGGQRTGGARSDGQRTGGKPAGEGRGNGGQRSDGQRTGGQRQQGGGANHDDDNRGNRAPAPREVDGNRVAPRPEVNGNRAPEAPSSEERPRRRSRGGRNRSSGGNGGGGRSNG
ncbi:MULTISPECIES: DEAD/DEAH box helicase [Cobetia]|uniref:DEAD/DEAH box helicase n=1 Tax=Cobetia TaxID=204286 RepID=UPI00098751EB|nr:MULTISPECIES: DEAD/DEAH box helicase [Cobetia]POR08187.1 ATP-dependent RNA helicase [Cobetia sp. MM1IDA2H-1]